MDTGNQENLPFLDYRYIGPNKEVFTRIFSKDVDESELVWHRDYFNRIITVVSGTGWKVQMDNSFPREVKEGDSFEIPGGEYHRLIRGSSDLTLLIVER